MANPLPPGAIPALRRAKRGGQFVGSYTFLLKGKRVNTRTDDYLLARERAKEAVNTGRTEWPTAEKAPPQSAAPNVERTSSDDWAADLMEAASAIKDANPPPPISEPGPEKKPAEPDAYVPPIKPSDAPKPEADKDSTQIPPEFLDDILNQAAAIAVELQLMGHSWLAKRWAKIELGEVPIQGQNAAARRVGVELWKQALKELIPDNVPIPAWIAAPLMVAALGLPVQIAGSEPVEASEAPTQ